MLVGLSVFVGLPVGGVEVTVSATHDDDKVDTSTHTRTTQYMKCSRTHCILPPGHTLLLLKSAQGLVYLTAP